MSQHRTALVAFVHCGCVVAADLDGEKKSHNDYMKRGLGVRWVTPEDAVRLIREGRNCKHVKEEEAK